ncbi:hypothetical protein BB8028_0004g11710 [Beauveria bassiana]|uniref:Uncharacterized protein n=1 Tax=Beauveria bassiana TaxID=176275 RepID=A0A2S7YDH9_BEABA|nr:hypothetical protein BB8028_0004g11710 [Beauveria bassiana]
MCLLRPSASGAFRWSLVSTSATAATQPIIGIWATISTGLMAMACSVVLRFFEDLGKGTCQSAIQLHRDSMSRSTYNFCSSSFHDFRDRRSRSRRFRLRTRHCCIMTAARWQRARPDLQCESCSRR